MTEITLDIFFESIREGNSNDQGNLQVKVRHILHLGEYSEKHKHGAGDRTQIGLLQGK